MKLAILCEVELMSVGNGTALSVEALERIPQDASGELQNSAYEGRTYKFHDRNEMVNVFSKELKERSMDGGEVIFGHEYREPLQQSFIIYWYGPEKETRRLGYLFIDDVKRLTDKQIIKQILKHAHENNDPHEWVRMLIDVKGILKRTGRMSPGIKKILDAIRQSAKESIHPECKYETL